MKKMIAIAAVLAALVLMTGGAFGAKVLKVGTNPAFPPFESTTDKGEIIGFDIDLIKAIGAAAGYDVQIISVAWDGIIPGLIAGNYDVIASAMTITEERKLSVNFADPYFEASQVIVTLKKNKVLNTLAELTGKKISVQLGTTGDFVATDEVKGGIVKRFDLAPMAVQELINGAVDAMIVDDPVAKTYVKQFSTLQYGAKVTEEFYGYAIAKKNTQILADVNAALKQLKSNGTYDQIFAKWFGK